MRMIVPDWPAAAFVQAVSTTREGGMSTGAFSSLNLGMHVGDDPVKVAQNREKLAQSLGLPCSPVWLNQVHGRDIIEASSQNMGSEADGSIGTTPDEICAVMTADCLPILLAMQDGSGVAALHGGWKGLLLGILEAAIERFDSSNLWVWLGPAIGPRAFEVGLEVKEAFALKHPTLESAFTPTREGKFLADIYRIARGLLEIAGVSSSQVVGGDWCTYTQTHDFFSYRRDHTTGRMATLIRLKPNS